MIDRAIEFYFEHPWEKYVLPFLLGMMTQTGFDWAIAAMCGVCIGLWALRSANNRAEGIED